MKNFGLIGYPLSHSFSKQYFTGKFEREKMDAKYELYELVDIKEFTKLIQSVELTGVNVTIPYKEQIIPFLDELDETAAAIGAVNVIQFIRKNNTLKLKGYNTDMIGFTESIRPRLKPYHTKALILGTGGAAKAVDFALRKMGMEVKIVSRNPNGKKQQTVSNEQNKIKGNIIAYTDLDKQTILDNLLIVNASPVGMYPNEDECPAIPYQFLTHRHLLFDAVYNPAETLFMKKGREQGADVMNGEEMLILQAEAAWRVWLNV